MNPVRMMSMEHKAFVFDFARFDRGLRPVLVSSLHSADVEPLRRFIMANQDCLVDPYEGEPLGDDWETVIEDQDVHQYGDVALTKYYSPTADQGLGANWATVQELLTHQRVVNSAPFLGAPVGEAGVFFDPGKLGSYFQTQAELIENVKAIETVKSGCAGDLHEALTHYVRFLRQASADNKGLYVTF